MARKVHRSVGGVRPNSPNRATGIKCIYYLQILMTGGFIRLAWGIFTIVSFACLACGCQNFCCPLEMPKIILSFLTRAAAVLVASLLCCADSCWDGAEMVLTRAETRAGMVLWNSETRKRVFLSRKEHGPLPGRTSLCKEEILGYKRTSYYHKYSWKSSQHFRYIILTIATILHFATPPLSHILVTTQILGATWPAETRVLRERTLETRSTSGE